MFLLGLMTMSVVVSAQEVISTAGGDHSNGSDRITYTIGQPVYHTVSTGNSVLTQGFQQPWAVVTGIEDPVAGVGVISVFPNPVGHSLNIQSTEANAGHFALYGVDGRLVTTGPLTGPLTTVDMEEYSNGDYLLNITGTDQEPLGTHKIIVTR